MYICCAFILFLPYQVLPKKKKKLMNIFLKFFFFYFKIFLSRFSAKMAQTHLSRFSQTQTGLNLFKQNGSKRFEPF
jgi:TRAP-type C4-dicarboxylate transport system permease small subunit